MVTQVTTYSIQESDWGVSCIHVALKPVKGGTSLAHIELGFSRGAILWTV
jgi:hypothetical protein